MRASNMTRLLNLMGDLKIVKIMSEERAKVAVHPVVMLGVTCHFRPNNDNVSACGIECPEYSAYDGRDVDCNRCRKTKKWKIYMGLV